MPVDESHRPEMTFFPWRQKTAKNVKKWPKNGVKQDALRIRKLRMFGCSISDCQTAFLSRLVNYTHGDNIRKPLEANLEYLGSLGYLC